MKPSQQAVALTVPAGYPSSVFFVDESTAKASAGNFFVVGAVKVRKPGALLREVRHLRDRYGYYDEFKFSRITRAKMPMFCELVDLLAQSDAHIAACVVDRQSAGNPFKESEETWVGHARVTAALIAGNINQRELATALLDDVSTPRGQTFDDMVRRMVHRRLKGASLVSAVCLDSKCTDGLQLADLVAGAVALQRRIVADGDRVHPNSHKAKIANRLAQEFAISDFSDTRTGRVNILTYGRRRIGLVRPERAIRSVG